MPVTFRAIKERRSDRTTYDLKWPIAKKDLMMILEAAIQEAGAKRKMVKHKVS